MKKLQGDPKKVRGQAGVLQGAVIAAILLCFTVIAAKYALSSMAHHALEEAVERVGGALPFRSEEPLRGYTVDLNGAKVDDRGLLELIELIVRCGDVIGIELDGTAITDVGVSSLSRVGGLVYISLDSTTVTDMGIRRLETMSGVRGVSLRNTKVTKKGVARLSAALPETYIDSDYAQ